MESGRYDINDLVQEAQHRWLRPAEVFFILKNHENHQLTEAPPQKPKSGSLFLYNKRVTRFFRNDGHSWRKKKAGRAVREGHERLKVGNAEALNCYYAHGEQNFNFQRRSFWLLDREYEHIVLVHYREITEGKHNAREVHLSPDCSSALSTGFYIPENQGSISAIGEPCQSSSFSPGSGEFDSELLIRSNGVNYLGETNRTGELNNSFAANDIQAFGQHEEQLSLNGGGLLDISSYFEENVRLIDPGVQSCGRGSNQDENQGSISAIREPCQSSSFTPGSLEFNSDLLVRSNGFDYMVEPNNSPAAGDSQALRELEEQLTLNGDGLLGIPPYFGDNVRILDSGAHNHGRGSSQDDSLSLQYPSVYSKGHPVSGGIEGFSNYSNSSMLLPNPGNFTTQIEEVPSWTGLPDQDQGSCWIDLLDEVFSTVGQNETILSFSKSENVSANLAEQAGIATSQWLDSSRSWNKTQTQYMDDSHATVQNDIEPPLTEDRQFQFCSNNILTPTTTSMHQEVDYSKVSAHSSGTSSHEAVSNCYVDHVNQHEVSHGIESRLTLALKQKFRIKEISPEWGYATEDTKVIIVGSFLCDPSEFNWSCMFGEIEVPIQIVQEGVLCCLAPPHLSGKVTMCMTLSNRESCSEVREFEYRSKSSMCDNCSTLQKDTTKHAEELPLLVRLVQMLLCDPLVLEEGSVKSTVNRFGIPKADADPWEHIIDALLGGKESQVSTKDWLLQELLKDKLQSWLSHKYKEGDPSGCSLSKKEQGIIHLVAGLGFEWALNPILKCGVCVNYRDINGWTALHWAARFGREKVVAALIAAGASAGAVTDPTSQDPVGKTPGSIASASGHKGLAGYLSEVALTSHLLSLTLKESEVPSGSTAVEVERTVVTISDGISVDQISLKDSLDAVRKSVLAAARIQNFFRVYSYKRRQQREAAAACCDEYGINPDELAAASKLAFHRFHEHLLDKDALSIQKKYCGWKGHQEFLALRQKIVMIQAHVRGYQVRKRYKVILWAVGVLDKVVLRWCRKRVGFRGFQPDLTSIDESEYEDILKVFRKLKVDQTVEEALSRVLSMVESPKARQQYRRMLVSYCQAKADLFDNASEAAPIPGVTSDN